MNEFMNIAINEAKVAFSEGNVPVGAVIVKNNDAVAACHNTKNTSNVAINHAEILCIIEACEKIGSWYLNDCELYVTLKPCEMCMAAIAEARIKNVFYLLDSNYSVNMNKNISNIKLTEFGDSEEYRKLMSLFFEKVRNE